MGRSSKLSFLHNMLDREQFRACLNGIPAGPNNPNNGSKESQVRSYLHDMLHNLPETNDMQS